MKIRKLKAFVPRRLVRIVTVTPPKSFSYIDSLQGSGERDISILAPGSNL
jgi:hypothetical protein